MFDFIDDTIGCGPAVGIVTAVIVTIGIFAFVGEGKDRKVIAGKYGYKIEDVDAYCRFFDARSFDFNSPAVRLNFEKWTKGEISAPQVKKDTTITPIMMPITH